MTTLKIKDIDYQFDSQFGNVYEIVIENKKILFNICKDIINNPDERIKIYSSKLIDSKKNIFCIFNLFDIDANNKKLLTNTYKDVSFKCRSIEIINSIENINSLILNLLEFISYEFDSSITFNNDLSLCDLLALYNLKYEYDNNSFLVSFISYIKANLLINKFYYIFTFNLSDFLSQNDLDILAKELSYLQIVLIDIAGKKSNLTYSKTIIIDEDLCEI